MNYEIGKDEGWLVLDIRKLGQLSISVLVMYYMWYNEKFGHNTLIVYGAFLVMCSSLAIDLIKDRELMFNNYYIGIWWNFVIVLYSFITGFFVAYDTGSLLEGLRLVLQYSIIAFAIYYFADKSENGINWLLITINAASLLCCFYLITNPVENIQGRFSISYSNNPNTLGFMLVIGVFSIAYRYQADIKWIVFYLPQTLLMIYGVVRTGSRKALISVVLFMIIWGIIVLLGISRYKVSRKQLALIIVFIVIIFVGIQFILSVYSQSAAAFRMDNFFDESSIHRISNYKLAWKIFLNKPFFGGGLDQFKFWSRTGGYSHATYAEALADFGFIGCLLYFFPIIGSGYELLRRSMNEDYQFQLLIVLGLWLVEIFMGFGQIFFLDIMHFIAWTIIYIEVVDRKKIVSYSNRYKYLKNGC